MATPINSTAPPRKLPIKRKSQNPPNPNFPSPSEEDLLDFDDDDTTDEIPTSNPPPFKFHRIWSEPDELRFLQGLLACFSQGLVFPRDLNSFYDRFSDSMPQPYTRSQLSEKLRRLRKKYRIMSGRIERGQDPARLAPHDRDLLHLCTRLWHPDHAATSPFSSPAVASTSTSNGSSKRRRSDVAEASVANCGDVSSNGEKKEVKSGCLASKTVMDVFDESLEEVRVGLGRTEGEEDMTRKWREQRILELGVFAQRLRLVMEKSL